MFGQKKWFKPIGVAGRIALAIASAVILVTMVILLAMRFEFEERLKVEAQTHLVNILSRESEALNQELLRVKRLSLALRQLTINAVDLNHIKTQADVNTLENQLIPNVKDLIHIFDNISGWILFNSEVFPGANTVSYTYEQGAFIREPEYDAVGDGYAQEPWWAEAVKRGEHWTNPYYWAPWDADIISYSVPVIKDDKLIAVAGAEFFMKPFQERLRNIKVYDTGFVMLIDTQGQAIYLPEEAEQSLLNQWYQSKKKDLLSKPIGVDYIGSKPLVNQDIIAWHRLENGWLLVAQPKAQEMFAAIVRTYRVLTIILLITIPIALLLGGLLAKSLTKRLRALIQASEHFLENLLPTSNSAQNFIWLPEKGEDDLSLLNRAFNRLQVDVQQSLSALSISEAKYRTLVEYSEHLIFTLNTQGHFLTTNRAMENLANRPKDTLFGLHFTEIFENESNKQFWLEKFNLVNQHKQRVQTEMRLQAADGNEHVLMVTLLPILAPETTPNQEGHKTTVQLIMGTASDLTDRLNAEREIQRLLERDKAALSRLVSGIAHEMNTPLGNVMVLLSYLEGALTPTGETLEALQSMRRNLQRAVDLVNHFKALSASQNQGPKMETNLKSLISISLQDIDDRADLHIHCDPHLVVNTYPSAVMQVISALVDNALAHGQIQNDPSIESKQEHKRLQVSVTVSLRPSDNRLIIYVQDDGYGMTPAILDHIFDPFYTTKRGQQHSGLGLSVAYNAAHQVLGGNLSVTAIPYPEKGHGTTFTLDIPLS